MKPVTQPAPAPPWAAMYSGEPMKPAASYSSVVTPRVMRSSQYVMPGAAARPR